MTTTLVEVMIEQEETYLLVRLPPPPGPLRVDYAERVRPGERWQGLTYAYLRDLGPGRHLVEVQVRPARP